MLLPVDELRVQLASVQGQLSEQEHALAQSLRDAELTQAKQRCEQRRAEDSLKRADLAEKQLDVMRKELARARDCIERLEVAAIQAAGDTSHRPCTIHSVF